MGTSQADAFYLRWQNYESSLSECFRDLRSQSDFCDVTLVTSDCNGDTFRAHKLILSACSDFFKDILRQHPHSDPLIYLKGVSYDQLQSVLEFMYSGEVRISKEELNNFIAVAKELQIKGLNHHKGGVDESPNSRQSDFSPARKKIRKGNFKLKQKVKEEHDETMEVVTDDGPTGANVVIDEQASEDGESKEALLDDSGASGAAGEETNETLGEFIGGSDEPKTEFVEEFPCDPCNLLFKSINTLRQHIRIVHGPPEFYKCCFCGKVVKSKVVFRTHVYNVHNVKGKNIVDNFSEKVSEPQDKPPKPTKQPDARLSFRPASKRKRQPKKVLYSD